MGSGLLKSNSLFSLALTFSIAVHAGLGVSHLIFANRTYVNGKGDGLIEIGFVSDVTQKSQHSHPKIRKVESPEISEQTAARESAEPGSLPGSGSAGSPLGEEEVDTPVRLLSSPQVRYPAALQREGVEGNVELFLIVDDVGRVVEAKVEHGQGEAFNQAALEAARGLRFSPALKNGQPVFVHVHWTCRFRLQ